MRRSILIFVMVCITLLISNVTVTEASTRVRWGKTELKIGQIGKATILAHTTLVKLGSNGSLITVRTMKKGEEYRVYNYKSNHGGLYGVGGGNFIPQNSKVKYETPSKKKVLQVEGITKQFFPYLKWGMNDENVINSLNTTNYENGYCCLVVRDKGVNTKLKHKDFESEIIIIVYNPDDKKINHLSQTGFSLNKYSDKEFIQFRDDLIKVVSAEIGLPNEVFLREGKYYDAIWRNGDEELSFSTGIGGDGNPFFSISVNNSKYDKSYQRN
ncbi:hypothetical protein [Psychrobacillus psychrodurans]|uniref:hypothetical protein n=1 Tax=Psychrobacillus psychrodurans TaxID=126157 RepID=UPI003D079700